MNTYMKETLVKLSEANGPVGREKEVAGLITKEMDTMGIHDYHLDSFGGVYVKIGGKNPRAPVVWLDAHIDEPSFLVKYIDEMGRLYLTQTGFFTADILPAQRVQILTSKGVVKGGFGAKAMHIAISDGSNPVAATLDDLWVEVGAASKVDVAKLGIRPGNQVLFDAPCIELQNNCYMGKALDNRAACTVLLEVMKRLVTAPSEATVYFTFPAQEEVACRGARIVYSSILKFFKKRPDVCFVYDITGAGDLPQIKKQKVPVELGGGVGIKVFERASTMADYLHIVPQAITDFLENTCLNESIKYQWEVMLGCTNASIYAVEDTGVLTGGLSIPCRYAHSPVEVVSMDDMQQTVMLTLSAIQNIKHLFESR